MTSERMELVARAIVATDSRDDAAEVLGYRNAKALSNAIQRDPILKATVLRHLDAAGKPFGTQDARKVMHRRPRSVGAIDWATVNAALADLRRIRAAHV